MESNVTRWWVTALILILLFAAVWFPRVLALDAFVTADEPLWLSRSADFYQAIGAGDLVHTFQREHPGVTVTWAGTLAFIQRLPGYAQDSPGQLVEGQLEPWLGENGDVRPLELLAVARWWMVLGISLAITACFFPLRKLFGTLLAALAVLFVAWEPFFLALSRLLHLDGLVASLVLLALVAFLAWLYGSQQLRYLVVSGLATSLAVLTKIPAIVLLPTAGLLLLAEWIRRVRADKGRALGLWVAFACWVGVALLGILALLPALWVEPMRVLTSVADGLRAHAGGHENVTFFLGRPTDDPGIMFYPVAYLFRTTPAALVGLVAAFILLWQRRWPLDAAIRRRSTLSLAFSALIFAAIMTLGAKKFDRYILPAFLALDVVALLGLAGMVQAVLVWWYQWRSRSRPQAETPSLKSRSVGGVVLLAGILLFHGLLGFVHYPYYLTYYNPLVGGSRTAPQALYVGWGEGLDAAVDWLQQQSEPEGVRVASWHTSGLLDYFLDAEQEARSISSTSNLFDADYVVLYANQWQRGIPSLELVDHFMRQEPAHIVRSGGLALARIYDVRGQEPPDFAGIDTASAVRFGEAMELAATRVKNPVVQSGDSSRITLYLRKLSEVDDAYNVLLRLIAPDGSELWREEGWPAGQPTNDWPPDKVRHDDHRIDIPHNASPGSYTVMLSLYDSDSLELLPATTGDLSHAVASIEVQSPDGDQASTPSTVQPTHDPPEQPAASPLVRAIDVNASWEDLQLTALQHEPRLAPGRKLQVEMAAKGRVDGFYKISTRLLDPMGRTKAQTDKVLGPYLRLDLELPADAEPGLYTLAAVIYDPETLAPFPDSQGEFTTMLSQVDVSTSRE